MLGVVVRSELADKICPLSQVSQELTQRVDVSPRRLKAAPAMHAGTV
jgi:hypothetical protein